MNKAVSAEERTSPGNTMPAGAAGVQSDDAGQAARRQRRTPRHLWIIASVILLHLRYIAFQATYLDTVRQNGLGAIWFPLPLLRPQEYQFANRWNLRISQWLMAAGAGYAKCMKRSLVMAHLLPENPALEMVIGVLPGNTQEGHAWLELDGRIVAEKFDSADEPFREILRFAVHPQPTHPSS